MERYLPTGNEWISLPNINEATAAIEDFTFLSMQHKGMIDVRGGADTPLMQPFVQVGDQAAAFSQLRWQREHFWIPTLTASALGHTISMTALTPVGERGFAVRLRVTAAQDAQLTWGLRGLWQSSWHCVNEDKRLEGSMHCYESNWNGSIVFDLRCGAPLFAFAPICAEAMASSHLLSPDGVAYTLSFTDTLRQGQSAEHVVYWGLGFEEVAAATSAKQMLRRGWDWEYEKTAAWLDARAAQMPTPKLTALYNTNLFFCIFYAAGKTLDTEELVCATSRSTRYYVSAAYWDRDVLLWAFPAILSADHALAEAVLRYVFTRQRRNLGVHSRYIDGTVLEPGFELDELVSPILALESYVLQTGDHAILQDADVKTGVRQILRTLETMRHPQAALYETFLQPTDDEIVYPYLTYNNVLVWRALRALAGLYPEAHGDLAQVAEAVRAAVMQHCVFHNEAGQPFFAWSVDLRGHHNVYDEPPGSLQLLPYYGFCAPDDAVWQNTVAMIRSPDYEYSFAGAPIAEIGCAHAPYPWLLSVCNSLLSGHAAQALRELEFMQLDNGIACESVDAVTGACATGAAFATCAGFLCHSMKTACGEDAYAK